MTSIHSQPCEGHSLLQVPGVHPQPHISICMPTIPTPNTSPHHVIGRPLRRQVLLNITKYLSLLYIYFLNLYTFPKCITNYCFFLFRKWSRMTQLMCKCVTTQTNILEIQEPASHFQCHRFPPLAALWCLPSYPLIATCLVFAPSNTLTTRESFTFDHPVEPAAAPMTLCWTWPTQPMRRCTISTAQPGCGQELQ